MTTIAYDLSDFDPELSEMLADATEEYGLQNCHERAPAAYDAAPAELKPCLHVVKGILHADQGMEPTGKGEHSWLLFVDEDYNSFVIDPTLMAFFEQHGMVTGLRWELSD